MIPDKLYVEISCNKDSSVYWIGRTSSVPQSDDSVEYIRKDALLEWAKEKKKQLLENELANAEPSDVAAGINAGLDMLIGKLNSM